MPNLWTPQGEIDVASHNDAARLAALSNAALQRGKEGPVEDRELIAEVRKNRRVNSRLGSLTNGQSQLSFATGRPQDPMFYWKQNNLPYDIWKEEELIAIRHYCSDPSAPIWMADYSFKPIGEVQAGEEVIGWTWGTDSSGRAQSRLTRSKVLATKMRWAPETVKVIMESGREMICTPDHQWANPIYSPNFSGNDHQRKNSYFTTEYKEARVGQYLRHVIEPTPELSSEKERLAAAWLGGLYDGEGTAERIAQDQVYNPAICQRIKDSLDLLGIAWTQRPEGIYVRQIGQGMKVSGKQPFVNFLNWVNPVRRTTTAIDKKMLTTNYGRKDRVASIESNGPGWVVSMQTETGNYVAWGYASKNCRLLTLTHPILSSAVDIFSKYPLTGMEVVCKDEALVDFYNTLFMDDLDYEEFLADILHEYWTVGEAWPLGQFNESLGVWEDDELMNPDDIKVIKSPFLKEPRFEMRLPETIREIIQKREPEWEYKRLVKAYPELMHFATNEAYMPVSNELLKQIKFKADVFHPRGIPLMMRVFRAVYQEEMLNAAQDAIASRLYTPLILVRLGASATDLGTTQPWIPTNADLENFEEALDSALAADFRVLTHHFAVQMDSVFGKETMPDFSMDFDRLIDRQLQAFGMSRTMLMGAGQGETYAADALNRDVMSQLLMHAQKLIKKFWRQRCLIVAEAQEHFDYEERGGKKYPIMEEVLEVDEETGKQKIVQQPKLLVPDLQIKAMNMQDETMQRQFIEELRASGVPISAKRRLTNMDIDLNDEIEQLHEEQVQAAVEAELVRKDTFLELSAQGLPIPASLEADFRPKALDAVEEEPSADMGMPLPNIAMDPNGNVALTPGAEDYAMGTDPTPGEEEAQAAEAGGGAAPGGVIPLPMNAARPPESDEQRGTMPKPASRKIEVEGAVIEEGPSRLISGPIHSKRRQVDPNEPLN